MYNIHDRFGCGTGIFTRGLLARAEFAGEAIAELRAIEPVEGMRTIFNETVKDAKRVPRGAEPGTFESTGVEDGWADGIIIATVCSCTALFCLFSLDLLSKRREGVPLVC